MQLGIDASNLRSGGSITHLSELLKVAQPEKYGIARVFVWGGQNILDRLPGREWLESIHEPTLDGTLPARVWWQQTKLSRLAREAACDLLFVPGGTYLGDFRPFVTMSRNALPFEPSQVRLYGASAMLPRFLLLRFSQVKTIRNAGGTIFLNEHARALVIRKVGKLVRPDAIIPHGVAARFRAAPKAQKPLSAYSKEDPFRLLYVSTIDAYKHQWHVVEAVAKLVRRGVPVTLELVGHAHPPSLKRLQSVVERLNAQTYVNYRGAIPHQDLPAVYARSDAFIFASSCENLPNTLLEAMTAGLPIACSNKDPMPKILGDGGVYFEPEDPAGIAAVLDQLLASPEAREKYAARASERARPYTWERCADETLSFLKQIA
ncbi:MAG TPA: glycosyltransferase family 1 protein [Pyrinomonadaceae bacterium]|nr:glycosyltransferase family 1 protein [Pyrinomonadaceae bacterium]